jgi:hypothetical protein
MGAKNLIDEGELTMKSYPLRVFAFLFLSLNLVACDQLFFGLSLLHPDSEDAGSEESQAGGSQMGQVSNLESLMESLSAVRAEVSLGDSLSQPFFEVTGQIIHVNGEDLQVFEFADEAEALAAASQISPDGGSTATTMISWMASPHFYRSGTVIVIYVGDNAEMKTLLESILGSQFAGR